MIVLDGKAYSLKFKNELKEKVENLKQKHDIVPGLAVVIIGNDPASEIYVRNKMKGAEYVGIASTVIKLEETATQLEAEQAVEKLANSDKIDGIIVQLPLPKKFDTQKILQKIPSNKDVDGLGAENLGK